MLNSINISHIFVFDQDKALDFYVGKLGLITVDQIIPLYAPNADHNNEQGYIKALKHYVDTWQAGILRP